MKRCPKCGIVCNDGNFCTRCGTALVDDSVSAEPYSEFAPEGGESEKTVDNSGVQALNSNSNPTPNPAPLKQTNSIAIVGFIASIVGNIIMPLFGPILGVILSIVGLVQSKKLGSGKGFAIAGIIIGVLTTLMCVLVYALYFMYMFGMFDEFLNGLGMMCI